MAGEEPDFDEALKRVDEDPKDKPAREVVLKKLAQLAQAWDKSKTKGDDDK